MEKMIRNVFFDLLVFKVGVTHFNITHVITYTFYLCVIELFFTPNSLSARGLPWLCCIILISHFSLLLLFFDSLIWIPDIHFFLNIFFWNFFDIFDYFFNLDPKNIFWWKFKEILFLAILHIKNILWVLQLFYYDLLFRITLRPLCWYLFYSIHKYVTHGRTNKRTGIPPFPYINVRYMLRSWVSHTAAHNVI